MKKVIFLFTVLICAMTISACAVDNESAEQREDEEATPVIGQNIHQAEMINTEGVKVGQASFSETAEGVKIHVKVEAMEPGLKAIHIHETGKCEIPDFKSAGGHFNPEHKKHGFDNPEGFHEGDLPNIEISSKGVADVEIMAPAVTLKQGEKNSLFDKDGSALVIHEKPDDYKTDPAGDAGARIACGVIK